jgi:predicted nucleic acid-binding protein
VSEQLVCDSSAVVALLLDDGAAGRAAARRMSGPMLAAPELLPFEVSNIIRRHELAELIGADQAAQAHADLLDLQVELWPYDLLAARAWQLRPNLTTYDACYVAVAELVNASLVTLDARLARAPGLRCRIEVL